MKIFVSILLVCFSVLGSAQIYTSINGKIDFVSEAPLEIIRASSDLLQGALDLEKKTFGFRVGIKSFNGFNNPLQQVHFYENYLEANEFPMATFKGKILEQIQEGNCVCRAKGILLIHGVEVERIIDINLKLKNDIITYEAEFYVPLIDHNISLPRIVYQKIAEEILVTVKGQMSLKK